MQSTEDNINMNPVAADLLPNGKTLQVQTPVKLAAELEKYRVTGTPGDYFVYNLPCSDGWYF